MRTLQDAERDYDQALVDGATAVAAMNDQIERVRREYRVMLAAIAIANGGKITVDPFTLRRARDVELTITDNVMTLETVIEVKMLDE